MSVLLTGGEPLLHPDFLKIARYAKELRLMTGHLYQWPGSAPGTVKTAAPAETQQYFLQLLRRKGGIHDQITGVPGSFERSLEAMKACRKAGIDTYIKTVVMRQNAEDYEELLKLGKKMDVKVLSSLSIIPTHKGRSVASLRLPDAEGIPENSAPGVRIWKSCLSEGGSEPPGSDLCQRQKHAVSRSFWKCASLQRQFPGSGKLPGNASCFHLGTFTSAEGNQEPAL